MNKTTLNPVANLGIEFPSSADKTIKPRDYRLETQKADPDKVALAGSPVGCLRVLGFLIVCIISEFYRVEPNSVVLVGGILIAVIAYLADRVLRSKPRIPDGINLVPRGQCLERKPSPPSATEVRHQTNALWDQQIDG